MYAIKVTNLNKIYKLYDSNKDRLKESINPFKKNYHREFYALRDVSFKVQKGETVGIIGKNGSGKSTLLKIITGLLTPTSGCIEVSGRVSALLELGAGFNPEYTGIENIYLNGTIMGFSRQEIDARLEEIVSFADIGDFIHQPVKIYSSGMYIRLAFAVAINVEPEILIVDEVLAVGDVRFQQKCFRKINEFREENRTILFCTHDTGSVLNLCSSCLWLNDGYVKENGDPESTVNKYQAFMSYDQDVKEDACSNTIHNNKPLGQAFSWQSVEKCSYFGEGGAEITHVCFYKEETGMAVNVLKGGERVVLGARIINQTMLGKPILGFSVKNGYGLPAFGTNTFQENYTIRELKSNELIDLYFKFTLPHLSNGEYSIDIALAEGTQIVHTQKCWKYDVYTFKVEQYGDKYNNSYGYTYVNDVSINISAEL